RPQQHEVVLAARRVPGERHALRLPHRLGEQPVRPVAALVGAEEVGLLVVDGVDRLHRHGLGDVDRVGRLGREHGELLVVHHHVAVLGELVALHQVLALHHLVLGRAVVLLLHPPAALAVQPVERDARRALAGRVELDRDRNEAEGDGAGSHRTCSHADKYRKTAWLLSLMPHDSLARYRAKRTPGVTPEPFGDAATSRPRLFCVQLHAARRRHYDLRLEMDGVLRSWAVPNGFSADPATKRLAVQTEDHPVEYADFEGLIPQGEYGGGSMILWDRGLWVPLLPPEESMPKGKLLFELRGFKLRGKWTLVKTGGTRGKQNPDEWLLIKERGDGWVRRGEEAEAFAPESVLSGLTVEELRDGVDRAAEVIDELPALKAPRRAVDPRKVELMLARQRDRAFRREGWLFELKYDGYRTLAARTTGGPLLLSRAGLDLTPRFPEVARAVAALPGDGLGADGELVVLDAGGRPTSK